MTLKEIMEYQHFVVVGNTTIESKYAYKIKNALLEKGYFVSAIPYEDKDINMVTYEVVDLCINNIRGLEILKSMKKKPEAVLIQPGASSKEIIDYLNENNIPYLEGCALVGLSLFK